MGFVRRSSEIVRLNPVVTAPVRDVNDVIVMQTAITGEADIPSTRDDDFFARPASDYLSKMGIAVLDDVALMRRLRRQGVQLVPRSMSVVCEALKGVGLPFSHSDGRAKAGCPEKHWILAARA